MTAEKSYIDSILLCTVIPESQISLRKVVKKIKSELELTNNRIYVLKPTDEYEPEQKQLNPLSRGFKDKLIVTYNVKKGENKDSVRSTFQIHRNKDFRVLYTLNALNELIKFECGQLDNKYQVKWENYKDCLVMTKKEEENKNLQIVKTLLYDVIYV